jgi:hypothetical protein
MNLTKYVYTFSCSLYPFFLSVGFLFCQQVRWAIGDGRLNTSLESLVLTPPFHQRHLLWPPFSLRKVVLSRERLPP